MFSSWQSPFLSKSFKGNPSYCHENRHQPLFFRFLSSVQMSILLATLQHPGAPPTPPLPWAGHGVLACQAAAAAVVAGGSLSWGRDCPEVPQISVFLEKLESLIQQFLKEMCRKPSAILLVKRFHHFHLVVVQYPQSSIILGLYIAILSVCLLKEVQFTPGGMMTHSECQIHQTAPF